jgi:Cdc6-like AAA superfamily ATPase
VLPLHDMTANEVYEPRNCKLSTSSLCVATNMQELEDARLALQLAARDKQSAINQLRDTIELEKEHQITMMRDKIEQVIQVQVQTKFFYCAAYTVT